MENRRALITFIIILLLAVIFTAQNYQAMAIRLFLWEFTTSRALVVFMTLIAGAAAGWTGRVFWERTHKTRK